MRREIAVTKRATYKAEENVQALEKAKTGQDDYVASLDERVRALGEKIAVSEARLARQKDESEEARKLLAETAQEMELVAFEKKQLLQQWKSSLVQLARRDEALAAANGQVTAARVELTDVATEIEGTKREEAIAARENERLAEVSGRLGSEDSALGQDISKVTAEAEAVAAQYARPRRKSSRETFRGISTSSAAAAPRLERRTPRRRRDPPASKEDLRAE